MLRDVTTTDGMTADFFPFDMAFLARTATRFINEVKGINRLVYDGTSKPPGTIERECGEVVAAIADNVAGDGTTRSLETKSIVRD